MLFKKSSVIDEQVLIAIISVAPDPVVVFDKNGIIKQANHHTYRVFKFTSEDDIIGKAVEELIPERYREFHIQYRNNYMNNPVTRVTRPMGKDFSLFGLRHDNTEFPVEVGLTPIGPASRPGSLVMAYIRDISK